MNLQNQVLTLTLATTLLSFTASAFAQTGTTRVAAWKDDKKSAFLIMLDDSVPSDFQTVVPELQKRNLTATFYINPGTHHYKQAKDKWETELPAIPGVVYGNHTMTHGGLTDFESADADLAQVNEVIFKAFPGKQPRLISFAKPGVSKDKWTITDADYQKALAKNNLIAREPSTGLNAAQFNNLKTAEGMLQIVDDGIAKGRIKSILYHGVGGDWLVTPTDVFTTFLDGLVARKDQLWVTDHISAHKYETERTTAKVNVLENTAKKIRLELKDEADDQLYDYPLTLVTEVPADWKKAQVVQGATKTIVSPVNNQIKYDVLPNGEAITIQSAA